MGKKCFVTCFIELFWFRFFKLFFIQLREESSNVQSVVERPIRQLNDQYLAGMSLNWENLLFSKQIFCTFFTVWLYSQILLKASLCESNEFGKKKKWGSRVYLLQKKLAPLSGNKKSVFFCRFQERNYYFL